MQLRRHAVTDGGADCSRVIGSKHRGRGSPSAAANACGTAPVTLNVWGGYPENDPVWKLAGENFKKTHPNVDFTVFSTDLRGFEQKLTTALPSNTAGDVVIRTTNFLSRFIDENLLAPLPDDLKTAVTGSGYNPAVVADNTYKGNVWGVPLFTGGTAVYYNTDMYTAAGITTPPTSMEMLIDNAKKLAVVDSSGNADPLRLEPSAQRPGQRRRREVLDPPPPVRQDPHP